MAFHDNLCMDTRPCRYFWWGSRCSAQGRHNSRCPGTRSPQFGLKTAVCWYILAKWQRSGTIPRAARCEVSSTSHGGLPVAPSTVRRLWWLAWELVTPISHVAIFCPQTHCPVCAPCNVQLSVRHMLLDCQMPLTASLNKLQIKKKYLWSFPLLANLNRTSFSLKVNFISLLWMFL
jgi:hypothetical protein